MNYTTHNDQETKDLGKKLAHSLQGGDIVCLYGELGAGKTTLVKGIAEGLGIKDDITSPTFTLMNIYQIKNTPSEAHQLIHIDTYRLENESELLTIGAEDYLGELKTICIIEWPEKIINLLQGKKIKNINIAHTSNNHRIIESDIPLTS
jgi:tRNA threonylcarbamoyladenosine biosynthesis protein TsaE